MSYATRLANAYRAAANNYAESLAIANEALNEMEQLIAELNAMSDAEASDGPETVSAYADSWANMESNARFLPVIR